MNDQDYDDDYEFQPGDYCPNCSCETHTWYCEHCGWGLEGWQPDSPPKPRGEKSKHIEILKARLEQWRQHMNKLLSTEPGWAGDAGDYIGRRDALLIEIGTWQQRIDKLKQQISELEESAN